METLRFGDPNQALLFAAAIVLFGGLLGAIAYVIASNRGARLLGGATCGLLVVAAAAIAWSIFFAAPFYAIELDGPSMRLVRFYPTRGVTLSRGDVARVERRNEVTKNSYTVVLVVHTKDGRAFTSGTLRQQELAERYERLQGWLAAP